MSADPDKIEQRVFLKATPARVWQALTDRTQFARWWGSDLDVDFAPGASIELRYEGQPYTIDIIEMDEARRLVWQWHPGMVDPDVDYAAQPRTTVRFDLMPFADGTMLTVTETGFAAPELRKRPHVFIDNVGGWLEQALALRSFLHGAAR